MADCSGAHQHGGEGAGVSAFDRELATTLVMPERGPYRARTDIHGGMTAVEGGHHAPERVTLAPVTPIRKAA